MQTNSFPQSQVLFMRLFRLWLALILLVVIAGAAPPPVRAGTFTVINTNDSGAGSLRQAIADATANDTINFNLPYPATIILASSLTINKNLIISGPGASNLTISGDHSYRVFSVNSGVTAAIAGVTIAEGFAGYGSGIQNSGALSVTDSTFSDNKASDRGTINNVGTLNITNCTFTGNTATYGGIHNDGTLIVTNSTFSNNSSCTGGAILNDTGTLNVIGSTFSGNYGFLCPGDPYSYGGGIDNTSTATVINSTFTGNHADYGGGIGNWGTLTVINSTFIGNYADTGGGIRISTSRGKATIKNTLVANSTSGGDCYGNPEPESTHNLSTDGTCPTAFTQVTPAQLALGALTGAPAYFPLTSGSVAIDAGTNTDCPATDQRGVTRPLDGNGDSVAVCDIGSFELNPFVPTSFVHLPLVLRSHQ